MAARARRAIGHDLAELPSALASIASNSAWPILPLSSSCLALSISLQESSGCAVKLLPMMSKGRVEAFSDGVIAVAITLLALDLRVPSTTAAGSLAHRLAAQWPSYVAYVVSFLTIGIIWINHHAMLRRIVGVDHAILMLNLLLLMTICVLPFTTSLMATYLRESHGEKLAAGVWGGSFLLMSVAFLVMQRHVLLAKQHLLDEHLTPDVRRSVLRRNAVGLLPYGLATVGAILTPYFTVVICALVAAFYAVPSATSDVIQPAGPLDPGGASGGA